MNIKMIGCLIMLHNYFRILNPLEHMISNFCNQKAIFPYIKEEIFSNEEDS